MPSISVGYVDGTANEIEDVVSISIEDGVAHLEHGDGGGLLLNMSHVVAIRYTTEEETDAN